MIAHDLAGKAHSGQAPCFETLFLGLGHLLGLAVDELDAAGGAAGEAAASVQDVDVGILLDRQHQPAIRTHVDRSRSFNRQIWHPTILAIF